ncbi:MAG: class I SAM-dependent methyltransferase [Deltaproteobacteria bacterium]|nr:class I SAM-dependent methyltransferase [Deltaproteobacteria bacterium]
MDFEEYEAMYRAEAVHWWYRGMATIVTALIRRFYPRGEGLRILDAGCGTGAFVSRLSEHGRVTGFDMSPHAIHFCRLRNHRRILRASVMEIPFADASFDLVTCLDVLYFRHIRDEDTLREIFRVLVPGGRAIVRVPAYDRLRGVHDEKVSTAHRYGRRELAEKMSRSGLPPTFITHANTILFPLALVKRLSEPWLPRQSGSDLVLDVGGLSGLLEACLHLESRLLGRWVLPFGLSIIAVGEKPPNKEFP